MVFSGHGSDPFTQTMFCAILERVRAVFDVKLSDMRLFLLFLSRGNQSFLLWAYSDLHDINRALEGPLNSWASSPWHFWVHQTCATPTRRCSSPHARNLHSLSTWR